MNLRTVLLGASACVLLAGSAIAQTAPTDAPARPRHHHRAVESVGARLDHLERIIEEQQDEIRGLKAQVGQNAGSATSGSVAAASAPQPQVSAAQFESLQNQVYEQAATQKAAAAHKDDKIHYKGVTVTLGGFLAAESVFRSHNESADIASSFSGIPLGNSAVGHTSEFRMTARQSRISALIQGDADPETHLAMYGEFDFLGAAQTANSNESNSYTPRIRNLYGTIDWDDFGLHLLAGQNWSLLTLTSSGMSPRTEVPPPSIDAQYVPGFDWARQPQVRLVKDIGEQVWLGLSVENPQTTFYTGANALPSSLHLTYNSAAGSNFNSANTLSLNHVPDIIGKVAFEPDPYIHLEAFGLLRDFYNRYNYSNHDVFGGGFGGAALVHVVPSVFDFQFSGLYGQGVGRYGSSQLADVTINPDGRIEPIKESMLLAGATWHTTPALDIYLFGGLEHDLARAYNLAGVPYGYGNPLYSNSGCFSETAMGSCVGNTKEAEQITAGLWDKAYQGNFGHIQLGLQYSYTVRKIFDGVGGAPHGDENMIFTSFRYYPFQ